MFSGLCGAASAAKCRAAIKKHAERASRVLSCFFKSREKPRSGAIVAAATKIAATGGRKARCAYCPDRGMLSMQWKASERETGCYFLRRAKSNTKSTRGKPCDLGSKLY